MPNLLATLRRGRSESRYSLEQYLADVTQFTFNGIGYATVGAQQSYTKQPNEPPIGGFEGFVQGAYARNGVVFACQLARLKVFTEARFQWQAMNNGRPGKLFGTTELAVLETPWPNGSTGDLLARMIQDVDLAGNFFARRTGPTASLLAVERLRPDWTYILLGSNSDLINAEVIGYAYFEGGTISKSKPVYLDRSEVAHWAPIPDPLAQFRGMSWMTPIVREIRGDGAATDHKLAFWEHAATPNLIFRVDPAVTLEKFEAFKAAMELEHRGVANAWKSMFLAPAVSGVEVVGSNFKDMDLRAVQGAGETRIAAAAGVPPIIVGLSEGLAAATYSNYAQARRAFADTTMRHLWRTACAALQSVVKTPNRSRLWYDDRDIPFLQEDRKDAADIQSTQAQTIAALVREGFTPESVIDAVMSEDYSLLKHTGALSVQLVEPGAAPEPAAEPTEEEPGD